MWSYRIWTELTDYTTSIHQWRSLDYWLIQLNLLITYIAADIAILMRRDGLKKINSLIESVPSR